MKTRKNENKTRRSLPPCDLLHPVTAKFYYSRGSEICTFYDYERLEFWCSIYNDYEILETGHN